MNLREAAEALIRHWEAGEYKNCTGYMAGHIADLKDALQPKVMNDLRKAAEQALEALEEINKLSVGEKAICLPAEIDSAMEALRQALARPRWVGLTDDDIWEVFKQYDSMQYVAFSKAIEAKLQEKNS